MSIKRPGPDHLDFTSKIWTRSRSMSLKSPAPIPYLRPVPLGGSPESDVRRDFFAKSATGKWQMTDRTGIGSTSPTNDRAKRRMTEGAHRRRQ
jgi:hypothetical protein